MINGKSKIYCIECLKKCFESESFNKEQFTISAVQKTTLISFFEANEVISYGLDKGILLLNDLNFEAQTHYFRFSDPVKGDGLYAKN